MECECCILCYTFLSKLICLSDKNIALVINKIVKIKNRIRKPWFSVTLMLNIRKKNRLYKKFLHDITALMNYDISNTGIIQI